MATLRQTVKKILVLNGLTTALLVLAVCLLIIPALYYSQMWSEVTSPAIPTTGPKEQFEIAKLAAEIRQIRSDTSGSLFWLKMIALFVTVGGAVGGYLIGQNRVAKRRIEFENRKNTDSAYQSIVQELSDNSPLLRAAAAVKLGMIIRSFPAEWSGDEARREQLVQLTKQVLAASLSIEQDRKVLKTLTIALALHKAWEADSTETIDQSLTILSANIPFAFHIGDSPLPSGDYTVRAIRSRDDLLRIIDRNGKRFRLRLPDPITESPPPKASKRAKLVFHRYGERYFLSQVWLAGKPEYHQLPKSSREGTLEAQSPAKDPESGLSLIDYGVEIHDQRQYADVRNLDLSGAKAADAFWASINFSYSDFYKADLRGASLRGSILSTAQFRDANLRDAVFIDASCGGASFKLADLGNADLSNADLRNADLRYADLTKAILQNTRFEGAKVYECKLIDAEKIEAGYYPDDKVDDSEDGDKKNMITVREWLNRATRTPKPTTPSES